MSDLAVTQEAWAVAKSAPETPLVELESGEAGVLGGSRPEDEGEDEDERDDECDGDDDDGHSNSGQFHVVDDAEETPMPLQV